MENNKLQAQPAKRSAIVPILCAIVVYYIGYKNINAESKGDGLFMDILSSFLGYFCILLASAASIAVIYRTFKEVKTKQD